MKRIAWFCILLFLVFGLSPQVAAETGQSAPSTFVGPDDLEEIYHFWEHIRTTYDGYLPEHEKIDIGALLRGEAAFDVSGYVVGLLSFLFHEVIANSRLLGMLLLLTLFSTLLRQLQNAFESSAVGKIAYTIVFFILLILALNSFQLSVDYVKEAISSMTHFIMALLPLLLSLLAVSGSVMSASFFHPIMIFLMNTSGLFVTYVVLPLLFLSTVLSIVSMVGENYKATQLAGMLRSVSIWFLGAFLTIFLTVLSIQGSVTAVADGLGVRTAKFVAGNFIPVVGRMLTDATETVVGASLLIKNSVGVFGLVVVALFAAFPAVKILTVAFIYRFAASVIQPIGDGPIIGALNLLSKNFLYVFACLALVSLMFFLSLTIIIASGNLAMMIR
ncbi:MAG: stage III sporulation protein AE [Bacilli bacterium]